MVGSKKTGGHCKMSSHHTNDLQSTISATDGKMSRSYKHNPVITDHDRGTRYYKRQASKMVRRNQCNNGGKYKHLYESWDICDYRFRLWHRRWGWIIGEEMTEQEIRDYYKK